MSFGQKKGTTITPFAWRWNVHILVWTKHLTHIFKSFMKGLRESAFTESLSVAISLVDYLPGRGQLQRWPGLHSEPAGRRPPDPWWWDGSQWGWGRRAGAGWTTGPSWPTAANQLPRLDRLPLCEVRIEPRWARRTRNWEEVPNVDRTE